MPRRPCTVSALVVPAALLLAGGCASTTSPRSSGYEAHVLGLGDRYVTPQGNLFVLRIQDEYRVIRCTSEGPIKGCYEDVFAVSGDDLKFNRWMELLSVPGVQLAVVSPTEVAFRSAPAGMATEESDAKADGSAK